MADVADELVRPSSALTRGDLLKRGTAAAFAVGMFGGLTDRAFGFYGPLKYANKQLAGELRIMQWAHFVPAYDQWLDNTYVKRWGEANDVEVKVDHINNALLYSTGASQVAAQSGHDLFWFISPPSTFQKQVIPVNDIVQEVTKKLGPMSKVARKSTYNPKTKQWEPSVPKSEPDSVVAHKRALEDLAQARIDTAYARLQAAGEQFSKKQLTQGVKDFTAQVEPLRARAAVIEQALLTIDDAAHNPDPNVRRTLYTSTVANFIQAADQKAQVRYQLLNYFKNNVDPSVAGKWEVLKARMLKGALPGYTMEGMLTHLKNLRELTRSEIEAQRDGLVKRRPELDEALPTLDEFFPTMSNDAPATATPPATAPAAGGFDLNAWLKANPPAEKKP